MSDFPENCPQEIIPELISYLKRLDQKGIKSLYLAPSSPSGKGSGAETEAPDTGKVFEEDDTNPNDTINDMKTKATDVAKRLAELESNVKECDNCALYRGRTNAVFGVGDPKTRVMFIGEGPGRDEDLKGEPFVGRSGQLLTKILAAIDLGREDVYITNIVKCRPPQNRDPLEEEVRCCESYLVAQIEIIKPKLICALGRIAAQWLLDTKEPLATLRRSENSYCEIPVLVTYHPAALLRNPGLKKGAWEDFKKLKSIISDDK